MGADAASLIERRRAIAAPRQRVLMTGDTVGGVWRYALELSHALIERGHEVALATMGRMPDREQRREARAVRGLAFHPRPYKLLWMDDPWRDVETAGEWLLRLAQHVRPSVVHLNDFGHGHLDWPAPVLTVAHSCVLSWWRAVHGTDAPMTWRRYCERVTAGLRAAELVVAPTHAMLHALQRHYGALPRARVIANGRSGSFDAAQPKGAWILSAGRVDDAGKNVAALLAAAPRVRWPVCIAGGALPQNPQGSNVYALGRLGEGELARWFARAAIFAHPARYEPFGLAVLEAAQAGCALVLGDIDSLRELWDGAALFVAPDDHEALAHTLDRLIADTALRERCAWRARQRAQRYTPAAMADAYVRTYAEITAARLPRAAASGESRR